MGEEHANPEPLGPGKGRNGAVSFSALRTQRPKSSIFAVQLNIHTKDIFAPRRIRGESL